MPREPPPVGTPGTLFLVATPIGHLEDLTLRALRVLREADLIAAEDTRRTAGLLAHYGIATPQLSLHEHNERTRTAVLLDRLRAGQRVALVSDAGTPLVSDPGALVVRAALDAGIRVETVPGPSAVLAALVGSGIPADTFTFLGFPPPRAAEKRRWLEAAAAEPRTVVFFEAPHRVRETLRLLLETAGDRLVSVGRELTKVHEERLTGAISEIVGRLGEPRGEFTIVLAPGSDADSERAPLTDRSARAEFDELTAKGLSRRDAIAAVARRYQVPARQVYAAIERSKAAGDTNG